MVSKEIVSSLHVEREKEVLLLLLLLLFIVDIDMVSVGVVRSTNRHILDVLTAFMPILLFCEGAKMVYLFWVRHFSFNKLILCCLCC